MKNKNILMFVLVILALLFLYNNQENFTMTEQSNEAVQNIASVYANTSGTITVNNLNATGTTNLNNLDISGTTNLSNMNINGTISYNNSQPYTLTISIGNYKGPIYDASNNTFSINSYTIKQISGANVAIGVRNNKWWITQYPTWSTWTQAVVEIIPIPLNKYYSSYTNSGAIIVDAPDTNKFQYSGWATGPVNTGLSNYIVYDVKGTPHTIATNVTTES